MVTDAVGHLPHHSVMCDRHDIGYNGSGRWGFRMSAWVGDLEGLVGICVQENHRPAHSMALMKHCIDNNSKNNNSTSNMYS